MVWTLWESTVKTRSEMGTSDTTTSIVLASPARQTKRSCLKCDQVWGDEGEEGLTKTVRNGGLEGICTCRAVVGGRHDHIWSSTIWKFGENYPYALTSQLATLKLQDLHRLDISNKLWSHNHRIIFCGSDCTGYLQRRQRYEHLRQSDISNESVVSYPSDQNMDPFTEIKCLSSLKHYISKAQQGSLKRQTGLISQFYLLSQVITSPIPSRASFWKKGHYLNNPGRESWMLMTEIFQLSALFYLESSFLQSILPQNV